VILTPEDRPAEPDETYLVPDEDSDFDPEDVTDEDAPLDAGPTFVAQEVQDDGQ
jgi:hypothetical protein